MLATLEGYELGKVSLKKIAKGVKKATKTVVKANPISQAVAISNSIIKNPKQLMNPTTALKLATVAIPGSNLAINKAAPLMAQIKETKIGQIGVALANNPLVQTAVMTAANVAFPGSGALIQQGLQASQAVRDAQKNLERPVKELISSAKTEDEKKAIVAMKSVFDKKVNEVASAETVKEIKNSPTFQSAAERYYEKGNLR